MQSAVEGITNNSFRITGVSSGCALFMRFITFAKLDTIVSIFKCIMLLKFDLIKFHFEYLDSEPIFMDFSQ